MAVTWEVESGNLILKVDGDKVATIEGGLSSAITDSSGDVTSAMGNFIANVTVFTPAIPDNQETPEDEYVAAVPGVITLKKAALGTSTITLTPEAAYTYKLALEDADANHQVKGDENVSAKWEVTGVGNTKTATYYAEGTPTTWTLVTKGALADKQITYQQAVTKGSAVAVINGLNNGLREQYLNVETNPPIAFTTPPTEAANGVITIAESALPVGSSAELTVTLETGSDKYDLKLADGIAKFDDTKGTATVDSVENGTATITRTQSAGWEETAGATLTYKLKDDKTIATVSGLKSGATSGVTVSGTTITIAKEALATDAAKKVTVVDGTNGEDADTTEGYKGFALALKDATENKLGFEAIDKYWTLADSNTTAKYWNGTTEGWTLVTDAASDDKGKIVYTAQDNNLLATITNLQNLALGGEKVITVTKTEREAPNITTTSVDGYSKIGTGSGTDFVEKIFVSGNDITVSKDVLTHDATADKETKLTQGTVLGKATATTYQLGLVSSESTTPATKGDINLTAIDKGSTTVQQDLSEGWRVSSEKDKISYTASAKKDLATISGLADGATTADVKIVDNTIVLTATAIGTTKTEGGTQIPCEVTLTNETGSNYTIVRAEGDDAPKAPGTIPSTFKLELVAVEQGVTPTSRTVNVVGTTAAGYVLDNSDAIKKITYRQAQDSTVATITNLHKDVVANAGKIGTNTGGESHTFVEGVTLAADGTITLAEAVLTKTEGDDGATTLNTSVAEAIDGLGVTFKLALEDGIKTPATAVTNQRLDTTNNTVQSNGELKIVGTLAEGWVLPTTGDGANKKVTYTAEKTPTLATISGLREGGAVNTHITLDTTDAETKGTIELFTNALKEDANSEVTIELATLDTGVTDSLREKYKFALGAGVVAPGATVVNTPTLTFPTEADGTATLVGSKSAGWELDETNNKVVYVPQADNKDVATITGLSLEAKGGTGVEDANVTFNNSNKTVTLKNGSLANKDVTIEGYDYKLALDSGLSGYQTTEGTTAGFEALNYWEKSGTSAKYYSTKKEGWTLDTTEASETKYKKITYTPQASGTLLATITNLSNDFVEINDNTAVTDTAGIVRYTRIGTAKEKDNPNASQEGQPATITEYTPGVTVAGNTIKLSKNILGTNASKPMTLTTTTAGKDYVLALDTNNTEADLKVPETAETGHVWETGATTKYKEVSTAFWKLDETNKKQIKYTAQTSGTVIATITGLNPNVTEEDLKATTDHSVTQAGDITKGVITLKKNALTNKDVKITSNYYTLALNAATGLQNEGVRVPLSELSNKKWELNTAKTTATYKADVSEGYELAADAMSVAYTAKATQKTIATVSGLNGNKKLDVSDDKSYIGILNEANGVVSQGLTFGTEEGVKKPIVLTNDVLGTSKVSVTGTNYVLALDNRVPGAANYANKADVETGKDVWRVSGTNAIYKKVKLAHHTLAGDEKSITYTADVDVADGTVLTVKGIKSGLTVAADGQSLTGKDADGEEVTEVLKFHETGSKQIDLKEQALGTSSVTLEKGKAAGASDKYTLDLGANAATLAPKSSGRLSWALNSTTKTTAHLKGVLEAGYELNTDKDKITYTAKDTNHTFATITGLKSGLTNANLNDTNAGISLPTSANKEIKLDMRVLGTAEKVALDETGIKGGYTLALDTEGTLYTGTDGSNYAVNASNNNPIEAWTASGGTATFKKYTEAYYTPNAAKTEIAYKGRAEVSNGTIVTIGNLKSTIKAEDDKIAGIDETNTSGEYVITEDVLNKQNVTVTKGPAIGTYKFNISSEVAPTQVGESYWTVSGTTAKYQYNSSAGYTQAGDSGAITYQPAKSGNSANTIVTIEGLKSGLNKNTITDGIDVSAATQNNPNGDKLVFTLYKDVLGTTAIALKSDANTTSNTQYWLDLGGVDEDGKTLTADDFKPVAGQAGWVKGTDSLTLKNYTTAGYEIASGDTPTSIAYKAEVFGADIATVKGLKTNLTVKDGAQIDGIEVNGKTITFNDAKVFNAQNVEISNDTYSLVVDAKLNPKYEKAWAFSNGTATLTETLQAGYLLDTDTESDTKGQLVYSKKETVTTTISGLNNTRDLIQVSSDKKKIGVKDGDNYTGITFTGTESTTSIPKEGKFVLDSNVLQDKTITLTNKSGGGKYTIELNSTDTGITFAEVSEPAWNKDENSANATYQTVTSQGYAQTDDTKVTYYSAATPTVIATLKGLSKTATAEEVNQYIEVTAPPTPVAGGDSAVDNEEAVDTSGKFTIKNSEILANGNLTLDTKADYKLALEDADNTTVGTRWFDVKAADATLSFNKNGTATVVEGLTEGWAIKTTTKNGTTTEDPKTIVYTKAAPETVATVSGIKVNSDGTAEGIELTDFTRTGSDTTKKLSGTIVLSADALNKKNVTVTVPNAKKTDYTFTLGVEGDVFEAEDGSNYWATDGKGKAFYRYDTTEGYKLAENHTTLTYSQAKTTPLATISGLVTAAIASKDSTKTAVAQNDSLEQIEGISIESEPSETTSGSTTTITPGKIVLQDKSILGTKVTVSGDYEFELADEVQTSNGGNKWYVSGTTATYKGFTTEGYALNNKSHKIAEFKKETANTTLFTLKGIKKVTAENLNEDNFVIVNDNLVTLSEDVEGTSTITLVNGARPKTQKTDPTTYYEYEIDPESFTTVVKSDPVWDYNKGTATLKQAATAGFTLGELSDKGQQKLTYSKAANPVVATVKGLATDLKLVETDSEGGTEIVYESDEIDPTTGEKTYKSVISYDSEKNITVTQDALTNKNVTISTAKVDGYKLALDDGVKKTAQTATEWVVSGTTANYKEYVQAYHTINDAQTAITYVKPTTGTTYATVTGLKKNTTIDTNAAWTGTKDGGTLTLNSDNLDKSTIKITSKVKGKETFLLALDTKSSSEKNVNSLLSAVSTPPSSVTADNGGKAVIKGSIGTGFMLEFGGKTLTYTKNNISNVTFATVTGLAKGTSVEVSTAGVITLENNDLNKKNVTVTTSKGSVDYTLLLSNESDIKPQMDIGETSSGDGGMYSPKKSDKKTAGWAHSGTTFTLKGYVTPVEDIGGGYTASANGKTITYTAPTATTKKKVEGEDVYTYKDLTTVMTLKGIKNTASLSEPESGKITLNSGDINGNTLTLGGGTYAVEVDDTYKNKSVVGSSTVDNITVGGTGVSVTGGKGDDYIDLGSNPNNTLVYSNGDGNDVIANFQSTDKLQIKSGAISVGQSGSDVVVKVGAGSIKLTGYTGTDLTIYNNKNQAVTYAIAADSSGQENPLLADNNYSTNAAQLSEIVKPAEMQLTSYDFDSGLGLTKEDKFTAAISYAKDK